MVLVPARKWLGRYCTKPPLLCEYILHPARTLCARPPQPLT